MWILDIEKYPAAALIELAVFNPDNLPVKKVFIFKHRAIVIDPKAQPYPEGRSNKIVVNGIVYKFCSQCSRFFPLGDFSNNWSSKTDGLGPYCLKCQSGMSAIKYLKNRDYYLKKSMLQYYRKWEKAGYPKDKRLKSNREPTPPKHQHPWSRPGVWANDGPARGQRKK
jgi:hypothetical protein